MGGKGKGKGGKRFFDRSFFNNASNRDNKGGPLPLYPEDLLMRTTLAEHLGNEKTGGSYLDPLLQFPLQYRALDAEPVPGIPGADHVLRSGLVNKIPKQEGASVGVGEFLSDDDEGEEGDADNRITSAALSKANGAAKRFYFHDIRERVRRNYRESYNSYSSHNVAGGAGAGGGGAANRLRLAAMGGMYNATEIASAIAAGRGQHSPGEGVSAVNSGTTGGGITRGGANDDAENNQKIYLPASYFEEMRARSLFVGAEFFPQELLEPARPKASGSKRRRKHQHQQETTNMDEEQQQGSSDERNGSGSSETSDDEEKSKSGSGLGSDGELGEEDDDMFGDEDYLDGFADADANDFGEVEDAGGDVYDD
eukprot:g14066.t1